MPTAIAGAAAIMTSGNTIASASTRSASRRVIATSGDDSSMTGNSVQADIDQIDTRCTRASGANTAGTTSTAQKASAASRRSAVAGQAMSFSVAGFGRAASATMINGTAT